MNEGAGAEASGAGAPPIPFIFQPPLMQTPPPNDTNGSGVPHDMFSIFQPPFSQTPPPSEENGSGVLQVLGDVG